MRNSLFLIASFLLFSCSAKQEFIANKAGQSSAISAVVSTSTQLCSQSTLISPKVDVLLLWDNSSSAIFINPATKSSFNQLITSVSEKFDYHILSAPLIATNTTNTLNEASLVVKDATSVNGTAAGILRSKDQAAASLNFTQAMGNAEPGVDRVTSIIQANRANGIFRSDAYTIIVVMSNGDDTSCEMQTGYNQCAPADWQPKMQAKINDLLCLRGNSNAACTAGVTPLNSTMMRFINISALTSCQSGVYKTNSRYRMVAKALYEAPYTNGWPTSNDNLNPFMSGTTPYPDNYDICSIDFNHIFDGVNTAIKQTLIKHVYEFWPVAGTNASLDPTTIRVVRDDGKVLTNRTGQTNPTDGYAFIGAQTNHNTRTQPTVGEPFTGQMIQLFGTNDNDFIVYPRCLTVTYDAMKAQYGYVYLQNGKPDVTTMEVFVNGVKVPQSTTNGWEYLPGLQFTSALDPAFKIANMPAGTPSGYFLRLNGTAKFDNTTSATVTVYYTSAP